MHHEETRTMPNPYADVTGPVVLAANRPGVYVDIRPGLPSLTIPGMPGRVEIETARYLREWDCLPSARITVAIPRGIRSGDDAPSAQSIASYVQSALLRSARDA